MESEPLSRQNVYSEPQQVKQGRKFESEGHSPEQTIAMLPPNILLGAFIGGVFAKAGIRRREMYG